MICSAADPDDEQNEPDLVDERLRLRVRLAAHQPPQDKPAGAGDRHLDEEDPFPAVIVADDAAEDRPGDGSDQRGHRPDHGRESRLLLGEDAQQQHLRQRHDRTAEQAEQHARTEQHAERTRHAAQKRYGGERQVADDEGLLGADTSWRASL